MKLSKRMLMIFRSLMALLIATLVTFAIGGCAETSRPEASGKGTLRGINAIVTSPDIGFLLEERLQGAVNYKDNATRRIDDLDYNVHFDVLFAGDTLRTRIASQHVDVAANTEYVFALTGSLSAPVLMTSEYPERQWASSDTVFEGRVLHLATVPGDLDFYIAAPGTVPVLGQARASPAFGVATAAFELAAGDYEITLTPKDDPGNVLYRSNAFSQVAATSILFGIFDGDPSITGNLTVRAMSPTGASTELPDADRPPTIRVVHAAFGTANVDMYAEDDFTAPIVANLAFGEASADVDFVTDVTPVTFTPAGNAGVFLLEDTLSVLAGSRNTAFLVGEPAELVAFSFPDNRRSVETLVKLRLTHVATNAGAVDVYIHLDTVDINDIFPRFFSLPYTVTTGYNESRIAGNHLVTVTRAGDKNIVAGPLMLNFTLGDVIELALLDTADPNVFDIVVVDN